MCYWEENILSYSMFSLIKNKNSCAQRLNPLRLKKYTKVEVRVAYQKIQSALCKSLSWREKSFCTFFLLTKLKKEFKCESRGTFVAHFNTQWANNILLEGASLINSTESKWFPWLDKNVSINLIHCTVIYVSDPHLVHSLRKEKGNRTVFF